MGGAAASGGAEHQRRLSEVDFLAAVVPKPTSPSRIAGRGAGVGLVGSVRKELVAVLEPEAPTTRVASPIIVCSACYWIFNGTYVFY